jgi:hypothetical protein
MAVIEKARRAEVIRTFFALETRFQQEQKQQ